MGASLKTRAVNVPDLDMGNTKFSIAQSQLVQSPGNQTNFRSYKKIISVIMISLCSTDSQSVYLLVALLTVI